MTYQTHAPTKYTPPQYIQQKIIRKPEVIALTGLSKSTIHNRINDGLFPPSISLGARAVAFVASEVDAVISAMIEERQPEQIKVLVQELIASRTANKRGV